jgi:hypothetical protein
MARLRAHIVLADEPAFLVERQGAGDVDRVAVPGEYGASGGAEPFGISGTNGM